MKLFPMLALILLLLLVPALTSCHQTLPGSDAEPRAAIVDQLYVLEPDSAFVSQATAILESAGFSVDVWQGEAVTVDFYRELPRQGYKLIILRVHSGILLAVTGSLVIPSATTYLFTGETYNTSKYVSEQLTDRVSSAMMTDKYPLVFAVNSEFIADDFKGNFNNTAIISMGCEGYYQDDLATAFLKKGASVYVGWNTVVSLDYVDKATLNLLDNLCVKNMTVPQGITSTMAEVGTDPYFNAYLKYQYARKGDQTIAALIRINY